MGGKPRRRQNLRHIPLDDGNSTDIQKMPGKIIPQAAAGDAHQIKKHRNTRPFRRPQRTLHGFHPHIRNIPQIQHQRPGRSRDLLHLQRMLRHNGPCPRRQDNIGAVMNGDGVGNAVNQRLFLSNTPSQAVQTLFPYHKPSLPDSTEILQADQICLRILRKYTPQCRPWLWPTETWGYSKRPSVRPVP